MARKDIKKGASQRADEMYKNSPEFMTLARLVVDEWGRHPGENYLTTAIAEGLKQMYELGLARSPLPAPASPEPSAVRRRTRPAEVVEAEPAIRVTRRRTRG